MTDLLGFGSNAPNVVITRPADNRIFGVPDTYAKDCSSPNAGDGTGIFAAWGNAVLGQLRALIRSNGQTAALADIVPVDNADDTMALKAIQYLIQRGLPRFGVDSGAANALVVALNPALSEYKAGTSIKVLVANDGTGAATINVNGLGVRDIVRKDGSALQPRDLVGGGIVTLTDTGAVFQLTETPAGFSSAADRVTSSAALNLTLAQRAIALDRTAAPAAMVINLPAGAANGKEIVIEDIRGNLSTAPATVTAPGGETVAQAANYVMDRDFQSTTFRLYVTGGTRTWSRST